MAVASDGRGPGFDQFREEIMEVLQWHFHQDEVALENATDAVAHHLATTAGFLIINGKIHVVAEVNWRDWDDEGQSWDVYTEGRS